MVPSTPVATVEVDSCDSSSNSAKNFNPKNAQGMQRIIIVVRIIDGKQEHLQAPKSRFTFGLISNNPISKNLKIVTEKLWARKLIHDWEFVENDF